MAINTPEPGLSDRAATIATSQAAGPNGDALRSDTSPVAAGLIIPALPAVTVLALASGGLALGSWLSVGVLALALGLVQLALVFSWVIGTALPGRRGALIIAICGSVGVDATALRWYEHGYASALAVVGLGVPAVFCHQLSRGAGRARVVESLADVSMVLLAVVASSGLLLLRRQADGDRTATAVVVVAAAAIAAGYLVDAVAPAARFDPEVDRGLIGLFVGTAVGAGIAVLLLAGLVGFDVLRSLAFGVGLALVAGLVSVGMSFAGQHSTQRSSSSRVVRLQPVAAALLSLAAVVPVGYVLLGALAL